MKVRMLATAFHRTSPGNPTYIYQAGHEYELSTELAKKFEEMQIAEIVENSKGVIARQSLKKLALDETLLPHWVVAVLKKNGVETVEELLAMSKQQILDIKGIGAKSLEVIEDALAQHGLKLE